ncbi:hypothetical protein JCM6882_002056 [Rhodosporidiobolus microsporus]
MADTIENAQAGSKVTVTRSDPSFFSRELPDYETLRKLYSEGRFTFPDPPTIADHGAWPKILPPPLADQVNEMVNAALKSPAYRPAWTEDLAQLHGLLSEEEWARIMRDSAMDLLAVREYRWRGMREPGYELRREHAREQLAASDRYYLRLRECLDSFFSRPLPSDLSTLFHSRRLSFPDAPTIASHGQWPRIIPPRLQKQLTRAAKAVHSSRAPELDWNADLAEIYALLSGEEWERIESDDRMDMVATYEYWYRFMRGRNEDVISRAEEEQAAASKRLDERFRDCLSIRIVHDALCNPAASSTLSQSSSCPPPANPVPLPFSEPPIYAAPSDRTVKLMRSDSFFSRPLPSDLSTLFHSRRLSFPDAPTIASHGQWPRIIPPHLTKQLTRAATAVRSARAPNLAWNADLAAIYALLSEEEWVRIERDYAMDVVATYEYWYGEKRARDIREARQIGAELKAALKRIEERFRDCLSIRIVRRALFAPAPPLNSSSLSSPFPDPLPPPEPLISLASSSDAPDLSISL